MEGRRENRSISSMQIASLGGGGRYEEAPCDGLPTWGFLGNSKLAIDIAFLREVEIAVKSGSVS